MFFSRSNTTNTTILILLTLPVISLGAFSFQELYGDSAYRIGEAYGPSKALIYLNHSVIHAEIAQTPAARKRGLGDRVGIAQDEGMLFIFDEEDYHRIWMKGMRFSIDILWLDSQFHIVDIAAEVSPDTYPRSFAPKRPARYVLEVSSGYAQAHNIHVGDIVHI